VGGLGEAERSGSGNKREKGWDRNEKMRVEEKSWRGRREKAGRKRNVYREWGKEREDRGRRARNAICCHIHPSSGPDEICLAAD